MRFVSVRGKPPPDDIGVAGEVGPQTYDAMAEKQLL